MIKETNEDNSIALQLTENSIKNSPDQGKKILLNAHTNTTLESTTKTLHNQLYHHFSED